MDDFITIRLENIPPSTNAMYANRSQNGKNGRVKTAEYQKWRQIAALEIMIQRNQWPVQSIESEFAICAVWPYNGKRDLDNYWKPTLDLLQWMKVIRNDNDCIMHMGYKSKMQEHGLIVLKPVTIEQVQDDINNSVFRDNRSGSVNHSG